MRWLLLLSLGLLTACGSGRKKGFNYCKEMRKTGREIEAAQNRGAELRERLDHVPPGTDSTETQRFALVQEIQKNNDQITYLKTYNQTNAQFCRPASQDLDQGAAGDAGGYR